MSNTHRRSYHSDLNKNRLFLTIYSRGTPFKSQTILCMVVIEFNHMFVDIRSVEYVEQTAICLPIRSIYTSVM